MLEYILEFTEIRETQKGLERFDRQSATVASYTGEALSRKPSGRKELQARASEVIAVLGLYRPINIKDSAILLPWANPSQLPTFGQILAGRYHNPSG